MTDDEFKQLTSAVYKRVVKAFDYIDPDEAEASYQLDNVTITFKDKTIFVINRQPPVHQLWLATKEKGYHFFYDGVKQQWLSTKTKEEFFEVIKKSAKKHLDTPEDLNF